MTKSKGKKHMSPEALAANRVNAQHSTGPITPQSAEAMGQRALKHGLSSQVVMIMPWESLEAYKDFIMMIIWELAPKGMLENEVAYRIAVSNWRLRRIEEFEARMALRFDEEEFALFLAEGPYKLERYQASIYRDLARDEARLAALKAARKDSADAAAENTTPPAGVFPRYSGTPFVHQPKAPLASPAKPQKKDKYGNLNAWAKSFGSTDTTTSPATPPENGFELQNPMSHPGEPPNGSH